MIQYDDKNNYYVVTTPGYAHLVGLKVENEELEDFNNLNLNNNNNNNNNNNKNDIKKEEENGKELLLKAKELQPWDSLEKSLQWLREHQIFNLSEYYIVQILEVIVKNWDYSKIISLLYQYRGEDIISIISDIAIYIETNTTEKESKLYTIFGIGHLAIEKVAELVLFFEKENYLKKDEFTFFISSSTKEWFYAIDDPLYILFLQRLTKEWDISQISDLLYSFSLDDDESTWDTNNPQFISFLLDFTKDWDNNKKIEFIDSLAEEWDWDDELVEKLKIVLKNDLTIEKEKIEETVTKVQVSSEVTDQTKETNIISEKSSNKKKKKKKKKKKNI